LKVADRTVPSVMEQLRAAALSFLDEAFAGVRPTAVHDRDTRNCMSLPGDWFWF